MSSHAASIDSKKFSVPSELTGILSKIPTQEYVHYVEDQLRKKPHRSRDCASKVIHIPGFDYFMGIVILLNMAAMIVEADSEAREDDSSSIRDMTQAFGWFVLGIFIVELILRLFAFRSCFFRDSWNIFDLAVVVVDTVFSLAALLAGPLFPVSILRVFRLAKLARVFKVLRVFPELQLLLTGLISSISAILWGTVLLLFSMLVWSLVAVLYIHPLSQTIDYDGCERCGRAFSSVMHSTLTLWQSIVAGDSWGQATIPMIEKYPSTIMFFIPVYLSVGMAVVNLILGVVVNVAQQAQDKLLQEDDAKKALCKLEKHTHLIELCRDMDVDGTGELSQAEVYAAFETPGEFRESILALDITKDEFDIVWAIIDPDHNGSVSYSEFVRHLCTMKVSDTQFMLAYIKYYITMFRNSMVEKMDDNHEKDMKVVRKLERSFSRIEENEEALLKDEKELLHQSTVIFETLKTQADAWKSERAPDAQTWRSERTDAQMWKSESRWPSEGTNMPQMDAETSRGEGADGCQADASRHTNIDCLLTQSMHDEMQIWQKQVSNDIEQLRVEVRAMWMDVNRKLGARTPAPPAMNWDIISTNTQSDLLVMPAKEPSHSSLSMCCSAVPRREKQVLDCPALSTLALEKQGAQASMSLSQSTLLTLRPQQ